MSDDSPLDQPRILQRAWQRSKPHLPRWASLPCLRQVPRDRPLFTCERCGFSNTLIPLCLWCCWTSAEATKRFEASIPRARRMSAPTTTFSTTRGIAAPCRGERHSCHTRSTSYDTALSTPPLITPFYDAFAPQLGQGAAKCEKMSMQLPEGGISDDTGSDWLLIESISNVDSDVFAWDRQSAPPVLGTRLKSRRRPTPLHGEHILSFRIPDQSSPLSSPHTSSLHTPFRATSTPMQHTLRRQQKRIFKKLSSHSLTGRVSIAKLARPDEPHAKSVRRKGSSLNMTVSGTKSPASVRLGHPHRPYYSVIRKDRPRTADFLESIITTTTKTTAMTPKSFSPLKSPHRVTTIHSPSYESESPVDELSLRPRSLCAGAMGAGAGFSLSGEMELRMALAQRASLESSSARHSSSGSAAEFRFHKTRRSRLRDSGMSLKENVVRVGRELKEAVLRK